MKWKVIIENANGEQYEVVRQFDGGECNAATCDLYTDAVCNDDEGHALSPCDEAWKVLDALSGPFGYLRFRRGEGRREMTLHITACDVLATRKETSRTKVERQRLDFSWIYNANCENLMPEVFAPLKSAWRRGMKEFRVNKQKGKMK